MTGRQDSIAQFDKMLLVFHLLCEDVSRIDFAWDVDKGDLLGCHGITDSHFSNVEVAETFSDGAGVGPVDSPLIVCKQVWSV